MEITTQEIPLKLLIKYANHHQDISYPSNLIGKKDYVCSGCNETLEITITTNKKDFDQLKFIISMINTEKISYCFCWNCKVLYFYRYVVPRRQKFQPF